MIEPSATFKQNSVYKNHEVNTFSNSDFNCNSGTHLIAPSDGHLLPHLLDDTMTANH